MPDYLQFMEPLALREGTEATGTAVAVIVVIVASASDVEAIAPVIGAATLATDASLISITTSDDLAALQLVVAGQLGGHSRSLAAAILIATGAMVFALMFGLVMFRRREFGRRRALGASQTLIVVLVLGRSALAAIPGAGLGAAVGLAVNAAGRDPQPDARFCLAVVVLTVLTALTGAVVPAIAASRREPLTELRVP